MPDRHGPPVRRIWSLTASGGGTTIAGSGNSGNWQAATVPPWDADSETPVDLRLASDVALMVSIGAIVSSPSLTVNLDLYDDLGNLYAAFLTTGALTAAGTTVKSCGLHGPTTSYIVLPGWGRVSWTCTGGSVTGTEISLIAR